ncbi:ATP-dependent nuclease subunit B [Lacticaseibacillus rhamnosus]|uniref:ATP-dependent nuclease subunit B n=1 Tax=Lacticaseibacillus rhamnosus TaxID=47715 RepID=A0AAX0K041_LACRH|nr:ATP-dependent nuclease subunit B [Lacticaseibacillus rhamnosus]
MFASVEDRLFSPTITRSPAQESACKDLKRNGQERAITLKAAKVLVMPITRSQGQKPACKDLRRNGQTRAITSKATYTPVSNRPCSRSP